MPSTLELPLGYTVSDRCLVNQKVYVWITTSVPLVHYDMTKASLRIMSQTLQEFRDLNAKGPTAFRKLIINFQFVEYHGAPVKPRIREEQQVELLLRSKRERGEPDTRSVAEFDLCSVLPQSSATPEALVASPAWDRAGQKHRRVYGFISLSRSVIYLDPMRGLEDDGALTAPGEVNDV